MVVYNKQELAKRNSIIKTHKILGEFLDIGRKVDTNTYLSSQRFILDSF